MTHRDPKPIGLIVHLILTSAAAPEFPGPASGGVMYGITETTVTLVILHLGRFG